MAHIGAQLVEIASLGRLQRIGDAVQFRALRRVLSDPARRTLPVRKVCFEASPVALRPETTEPDAGVMTCAAAHEAGGPGLEVKTEDFCDALEILIGGVIPAVIEAALALLGAGPVVCPIDHHHPPAAVRG
jgi:hypothetical protein